MSNKELTLKDFGGEVLSRDKDGNPLAVYIHNEVQSPPSITDFKVDVINLVDTHPNNMELGKNVREYVFNYQKEISENPNQTKMDFSKSEYHEDQATKDRKRYAG